MAPAILILIALCCVGVAIGLLRTLGARPPRPGEQARAGGAQATRCLLCGASLAPEGTAGKRGPAARH